MDTTTKTLKIQFLVNCDDIEKKNQYYKQLHNYIYHTFRYKNHCINTLVAHNDLVWRINDALGLKGKDRKNIAQLFGKEDVEGFTERNIPYKLSQEYKEHLPTLIRTSSKDKVIKTYKENKIDIAKGEMSVPSFRNNSPVDFQKQALKKLKECEDSKNFTFELFGIPLKTYLGRDFSDYYNYLKKIINGELQMSDSSYMYDKNEKNNNGKKGKFFLSLVIKEPVKKVKLDENKVLGVDVGLNIPVAIGSYGNPQERIIGSREEFLNKRKQFNAQRRQLQKSLRYCKSKHGRKRKLKALNALKDKERDWVKYKNHNFAKEVIDFAIRYKFGTINIEDLEGITKENKFLHRYWSYFELFNLIEQKAKKFGIKVNEVKADYTSQCCSECDHISKDNRIEQVFECANCGHKDNADKNATKNISRAHTKEWKKLVKNHKKNLVVTN